MILYIAEKPSLGRAIADALPKPHKKAEGCIYVGSGDCVSWCVGHLLEQVEPDHYDVKYKSWCVEDLPIIPEQWQLKPKLPTKKQLSILRKLVKEADEIVHAGDPDREGQLLVDEVIDYLQVSGNKRESIQRCLVSDLNTSAVKRALSQLRPNKEFIPLSVSALARARADWLYGINMTRAYTLQGRKVGYTGVLSVGRVQTPLLGLVVRRDREIESFVSRQYYEVVAHIETPQKERIEAKWLPSEACQPYQDEEQRVLSKSLAEKVASTITGKPAVVIRTNQKNKKQAPPLPYNLSALQIDAAKQLGLSAKQILDICQVLYERHKLITYPRSDCRYLPEEHFDQRTTVLSAIANNSLALKHRVSSAMPGLKSKAWNNQKVGAHHAIIPTAKQTDLDKLRTTEQAVYQLVARQYLAQFYPPFEYRDSEIHFVIEGGQFLAKARLTVKQGWKSLFARQSSDPKQKTDPFLNKSLPTVTKGEELFCQQGELIEKQTTPPKPFDDASLLAAMTNIARYVDDPTLKQILKDTDGLGTEATRAGIIELLFKRGFLIRSGKQIRASDAGKGLVASLPAIATKPDMTARWEMQLDSIQHRELNYRCFMAPLEQDLEQLVTQSRSVVMEQLRGVKVKLKSFKRRNKSKTPQKLKVKANG